MPDTAVLCYHAYNPNAYSVQHLTPLLGWLLNFLIPEKRRTHGYGLENDINLLALTHIHSFLALEYRLPNTDIKYDR